MSRFFSQSVGFSCLCVLLSASCNKSDSHSSGDGDGDNALGDGDGDGDGDLGDGDGDSGDGDLGGANGDGDGDLGDGDGDPGGASGDGDSGTGGSGGAGGASSQERLVIASGLTEPTGIAVDDEYVYWADRTEGHVARCPLNGCGTDEPQIILSGIEAPTGIDRAGTRLFVAEAGSRDLLSCELDDCGAGATALGNIGGGNASFFDVVEHGGSLYYGSWPSFGRCDAEGCTDSGPTMFPSAPVVSLAADGDFLYSSRYGWSQIFRCSFPDCGDVTVLVDVPTPLGLAVSDGVVYFGRHDIDNWGGGGASNDAGVYSCPAEGCDFDEAILLDGGDVSPYSLAVGGDYLYFTNIRHGTVIRLPLGASQ